MPDSAPEYRPPKDEAERQALQRSTTLSFRPADPGSIERFLGLRDPSDLRVRVVEGGRVTAGLVRIPMAHFFAGARVPTLGIAAVSVPPEHRGSGSATALMRSAVTEAHADGFPLATLFASTRSLYRKAGFEPSGHLVRFRLPLESIGVRAAEPEMRPATEADHDAMRACYTETATHTHGALDRPDSIWRRILNNDDKPREAAVVFETADGVEHITGHVIYNVEQTPGDLRSQSLKIADIAFTNADAGRRLLAYLSRFATLARDAIFQSGPAAPILQLLPEVLHRCEQIEHWMLRIVDVAGAIEGRPYPAVLTTSFALEIEDDLIESNNTRFHVAISDGSASVTRASTAEAPTLKLGIRGLAPLYTGFLPPGALRLAGALEGDGAALAAVAPAFAASPPTVLDFF